VQDSENAETGGTPESVPRNATWWKGALALATAAYAAASSVWHIYFAHQHTFRQTEIILTSWRHRTTGTDRQTDRQTGCLKIKIPNAVPTDKTINKMFRCDSLWIQFQGVFI
jgi:hypothetical protein